MQITAIKPQARRPSRVSVFVDGKFAFGLNKKVAERFALAVGQEISQAQVQAILEGQTRQECFDKAMGYLARRMHSREELRRKLSLSAAASTGERYAPAILEHTLDRLQELGYVNDEEFARQKLMQSQRKLIGERGALSALMKSGLKGQVARQAVEAHFSSDDSRDNAQKLIEKNLPRLKRLDALTAKRRLVGLLQRRGFDYETIKPLIDKALNGSDED